MRRKSPRTAAPKATPEKAKSPPRKTRRSTRRKKQSSESTEDSQDEQSLQEIAKKASASVAAAAAAATETPKTTPVKDDSAEAVWKVTPSDTATTGEIQKLKISLTRPSPSTPERASRRSGRKSGGESSTQEDEKNSEVEEREEKRGKGKSKGKHKSKIEKTPQAHEQEAEMQSEISENVQVTAQSPPIDIPVDNASLVNVNEERTENNVCRDGDSVDASKILDGDAETQTNKEDEQPVPASPPPRTTETVEDTTSDQAAESTDTKTNKETETETETVVADASVEDEEVVEEAEKVITAPAAEQNEEQVVDEVKKEGEDDEQVVDEVEREGEDEEESAKEEIATVNEESVATNEDDSSKTEETEKPSQEESRESLPSQIETTTTESFVEYMEVDVSENEHFRNIAEDIAEEKKPIEDVKPRRKRKWGNNQALKKYFTNIFKVDVDTIKHICEEVNFLEENEVKLDSTPPEERRKSIEQKPKKTERKVSVEETAKTELKTQTSTNSEDLNNYETNANIIAMNRKISIVDDTASKLKPPPSPAKNPVAETLFITNLVRPFTIKQLKELLERTGKIKENGFWTDHIKSKCYVQYESSEEAEATRNALHGVQWPIGNGKKLVIEYATVEEMENAKNPPQTPPVIADTPPPEKEVEIPAAKQSKEETEKKTDDRREKRRKETQMREWDIGKEDLERRRSRSRERSDRKRHARRSASPDEDFITRKHKKQEEAVPQKLMDDLFQKTKATPCIYWLPLTPEEIAMKQQQRLIRMEEHKRRLEESVRTRADFGRPGPYRRRYD